MSQRLAEGHSFARARRSCGHPDIASMPGAILGVEYLKPSAAASRISRRIVAAPGRGYHSDDINAHLPSATAIRKALAEGQTEQALAAMPERCADIVRRALSEGLRPVFPHTFDAALLHTLRLRGASYIASLPDVSEGLENRIFSAAQNCRTREELIQSVKTKRYAYARISRILLCALLGVTKEMVSAHNAAPAAYVRVLAVRDASVMSALAKRLPCRSSLQLHPRSTLPRRGCYRRLGAVADRPAVRQSRPGSRSACSSDRFPFAYRDRPSHIHD